MSDLKFAWRQLLRHPGFTVAAALTLALGIGANIAIFSVIYGSWLRPLPFPDADRLAVVGEEQRGHMLPLAPGNYLDLDAGTRRFEEMAAYTSGAFNLSAGAGTGRVEGVVVTPDFFDVLGLGPRLGRGFTPADGAQGAPHVVVLSYRLWRDRFGADPGIVGRTIRIDAVPHTVIGVTPKEFYVRRNPYVLGEPDLFVPLRWTAQQRQSRGGRWIFAIGRLAANASLESARDEMVTLFAGIKEQHPEVPEDVSATVRSFDQVVVGRDHTALLMLGGAAALVLLVACVNVANLLLARAETRTRELAVRVALGARRRRLARTFLSEGLMLAVLGGSLGLMAAFWGVDLLLAVYGGSLPRASQIAVHGETASFALVLVAVTGVLVGFAPVWFIDPSRLAETLKATGHGGVGSRSRLRGVLVVVEIAMSAMLLAGAGLLVHSFWRLSQVDTGVNPENTVVFQVSLPDARYQEPPAVTGFYQSLVEELAELPGVREVGAIDREMFSGGFNMSKLYAAGDPEREAQDVEYREVTPGFFAAAGIPLLRGRLFGRAGGESPRDAVVISRELARQLFPDRDPVGQRLELDWPLKDPEIVGVVGDIREFGPTREPPPRFYWPYPVGGYTSLSMTVLLRADKAPLSLIPQVRRLVARKDSDVPIYNIATLEKLVAGTVEDRQLALSLLGLFAVLALLLAAVGVYGVTAQMVAARTREVGIRLALGAESGSVLRLVLRQGVALSVAGALIGLLGAVAAGRVLRSLLWEVAPTDPATLAAVLVVLPAAALVATFIPALRASRTDPMEALRHG